MSAHSKDLQSIAKPPTWQVQTRRNQGFILSLAILIIAILVNWALQPNFFQRPVLRSNLATFLPLILAAVGQTMVVLTGAIDLSIGGIMTVVNVVTVVMFGITDAAAGSAGAIWASILVGLAAGIAAGLLNGALVAYLRLQPVIATFATNFVWMGLALFILPTPGGTVPEQVYRLYRGYLLGIPNAAWFIAISIILWWLISQTRLGRYFYAIGGSRNSAYASGIKVYLVQLLAYGMCGLFAGLSGIALTADIASGDPLVGGPLSLSSITATVIGGTRLAGGEGGAYGSIVGAVILGLARNIIFFANVPPFYQDFAFGLLVIGALAAGAVSGRRRNST